MEIEIVTAALENFLHHATETGRLRLSDFVNFMEPRFAEAGYRTERNSGETNILLIHDVMAGDFITISAAIREIRRIYPAAHITLVVPPYVHNLAECCPYVDEVFVNSRRYNWSSFLSVYQQNIDVAAQFLDRRYDICFAFAHTLVAATLMYMSGARIRIAPYFSDDRETWGYSSDISLRRVIDLFATHKFPIYKYGRHIVDANLALVEGLIHAPVANRNIEIWYTAADAALAGHLLKNVSTPIYALSMGSGAMHKNYPPEKYARVLELISAEEPSATFVILGAGKKDLAFAQIIRNTVPQIYENHVIDLTEKIGYRQCGAVINLCDAYIGNETGTMHVAAAVKRPALIVACFPADLPESYTDGIRAFYPYKVPNVIVQPAHALPECASNEPYHWAGCRVVNKSHCIAQIEPETVLHGFKILKERIAENATTPIFIS